VNTERKPAVSNRWAFFFGLVVGLSDLAFDLRPLISMRDRFRRLRKSNDPTPFAPSLNVQRDNPHNSSRVSGDLTASASQGRASANGRNCVPNKDRADFPPVWESDHTIAVVLGTSRPRSAPQTCEHHPENLTRA